MMRHECNIGVPDPSKHSEPLSRQVYQKLYRNIKMRLLLFCIHQKKLQV